MATNVPLSRTLARRGSLLCESGPIYVVSFYLITRHNSIISTEGWVLRLLHTSIFMKTPSLEGLPTKIKEDPSPHELRLSPVGHQPSFSWSIIIKLLLLLLLLILI